MSRHMDVGKDVRLIFDLIWVKSTDESKASIKEVIGEAKHAAVAKNRANDVMVGLYTPTAEEGKTRRRLVSFAALAARHLSNERAAILFVEFGNDEAVMAAVANGLPVPDTDRYGNVNELVQVAREYISDNPGTRVIGATDKLHDINVEEFDLDAFLVEKATRKYLRECQIKSVGGSNRMVPLVAITLLFTAYVGYDYWGKSQKAAEAARLAQQQQTPAQLYHAGLQAAIQQEGVPVAGARRIIGLAQSQQTNANGWHMSHLKCTASGCSATWAKAIRTATFADLIAGIGNENLVLATDQTAIKTIPLAPGNNGETPNTSKLPTEQEAWLTLLPPLQKTGGSISFGLGASTPFSVQGITIPGGIRRGEVKVTGPGWSDQYFSTLPSWALLREINYSIGSDSERKLSMEGTLVFFVK